MNSGVMKHLGKTSLIAVACALALGLAACDQKPHLDKVSKGKGIDSAFGTGGRQRVAEYPPAAVHQEKVALASNANVDAALAAKVKAAILSRPGLRSVTVDVNAVDGVITLYGTADTPIMSHQVAMAALDVAGVRSVKNEMVIVKGS
jgi:hypothetical protein